MNDIRCVYMSLDDIYDTVFLNCSKKLTLFSSSHHCFDQGGPEGGGQEVGDGEVA